MTRVAQKPRILLLIPCFVPYDAVGNDVHGMHQLLSAAGYEVRILAGEFHKTYEDIAEPLQLGCDYWDSREDILIYHHAIGWPLGEAVLARTRNKVVIKYHNITPARFFEPYAANYFQACMEGELATRRVARNPSAMFWGDSRFNAEELISYGAPRERCRWVLPCHHIEDLRNVHLDPHILGTYRDGFMNLLFVGGMKPNKGHALALRVFATYRHVYNQRVRMIFAGSYDRGLVSYLEHIRRLARQLSLDADTVFAHSVSPSQLKTFYYVADAFLCVSEHEGFCVPLVEAMSFRVPIVALGQTAIPETMGDTGIVHDRFDPILFADSLEEYRRNSQHCLNKTSMGRLRYETEFSPQAIERKLLTLVSEIENTRNA